MARKTAVEEREAKRFALILGTLLAAFASLALWRSHEVRAALIGAAAATVVILSFVVPALWLRVFRLWMKLAEGMSWVTTRVILSLFFYLVLTPLGLAFRIIRKDLLDLRWKDGKSTYWIDKAEDEYTLDRYEKQY